jgi:hypothetical protein
VEGLEVDAFDTNGLRSLLEILLLPLEQKQDLMITLPRFDSELEKERILVIAVYWFDFQLHSLCLGVHLLYLAGDNM